MSLSPTQITRAKAVGPGVGAAVAAMAFVVLMCCRFPDRYKAMNVRRRLVLGTQVLSLGIVVASFSIGNVYAVQEHQLGTRCYLLGTIFGGLGIVWCCIRLTHAAFLSFLPFSLSLGIDFLLSLGSTASLVISSLSVEASEPLVDHRAVACVVLDGTMLAYGVVGFLCDLYNLQKEFEQLLPKNNPSETSLPGPYIKYSPSLYTNFGRLDLPRSEDIDLEVGRKPSDEAGDMDTGERKEKLWFELGKWKIVRVEVR